MNETTKINAFKKDIPRLADLKHHAIKNRVLSQPEQITFLLDYYHDNELKKQTQQ